MNEINKVYRIPAENLYALRANLNRLCKRAAKLGQSIVWTEGTEEFVPAGSDGLGNVKYAGMVEVTITGTQPRLSGWSFAAVIDHGTEAGNIVRSVPGAAAVPASFRTDGATCDHCGLKRHRTETFALLNDSGDWKRVGRQCLADFLGHQDPHSVAKYAELLATAFGAGEESEESEPTGGRRRIGYSVFGIVEAAFAAIRENGGFVSRKVADEQNRESTRDRILRSFCKSGPEHRLEYAGSDKVWAGEAIDWILNTFEGRELTDFEHNLLIIAKSTAVSEKNVGIATYLAEAYRREQGARIERATRANEWIGTPGERAAVGTCTVVYKTSFETPFGVNHMAILRDIEGRRLKLSGNGAADLEIGHAVVIPAAFIKDHSDWKGTKTTVINRAEPVSVWDIFGFDSAEAAPVCA